MELLVFWVIFAVAITHICSLLETTLFSVRVSTLLMRQADGSRGASRLLAIKRGRLDDAIGAILIANTVAGILGASLAGAQAATVFGNANVGYLSAGLTVVLLIVSEIVPKTLAARYSGSLSGFAGNTLAYLIPLLRPILLLTNTLIRLLARRPSEQLTRRELTLFVGSAHEEGTITLAESTAIGSLIFSRELPVGEVMTPAATIFGMAGTATIGDLLDAPEADAFSRIPLYGADKSVQGYVSHRDVLKAFATGMPKSTRLDAFMRPIPNIPEGLPVGQAIEFILDNREALAIVTRGSRAVGLVTLEDLFEAILGMEITDEAEAVANARPAVAAARRDRLAGLRRRIQSQHPSSGAPQT